MVEVRRDEIIDAVQRCIVEYGLADTTMAKVADEAGMQRSAISHFLGNRDDVIAAAVERSCEHYVATLMAIVEENDPADRLDAILDGLIGGKRVHEHAMVLFDEVLTLGHHDEHARLAIEQAMFTLEAELKKALAVRVPTVDSRRRADVAYALLLIIDNEERFRVLGFSERKYPGRRARAAAATLIDSLES